MDNTEKILEFDKIKEIWGQLALTDAAKERIRRIEPCLSEIELSALQRETTEARQLLEKAGNPPLVCLSGLDEMIETAKKGDCLWAAQLEEAATALVAVTRMKQYMNRCLSFGNSLAYYGENLDGLEELQEEIAVQIRSGRVADNASRLLKSLREEIDITENRRKEKADAVIRANKECMSDSFSTFRGGRLCVPVKKEYKFKIKGSVVDKSATGNTLFIEPEQVAKFEEALQLLRIDAENEERRILYCLTALVADYAEVLQQNISLMERLDFIFSKGKLSLWYDGAQPKITTGRRIVLKNGRHPLMKKESCVPLQFEIGGDIRGIVITGPNTGGKTVAIKTVALNCMMAQCGLHVACESAEICMNRNILCDIGDGQNLSENLSTFSAHITNVLGILSRVTSESLVIMDELGSGTDPAEGMGIAIAILEELRKSGALFLVSTHYPEVKQYARKQENIINARMTFDRESLQPLYQMIIGEAGESCAFYIAQKMGMPQEMLQTAVKAAYGDAVPEGLCLKDIGNAIKKEHVAGIRKIQTKTRTRSAERFGRGDSVMVYPEKKIGIVCKTADEKGILQIQLPGEKVWKNHKRLKLLVAAKELYTEDYDFSIVFDTVENRKLRHQMERKYVVGKELVYKD